MCPPRQRINACRADDAQGPVAFSPLAALVALRSIPELVYLQARLAAVMSFELAARLLGEVLPLGRSLHGSAVRDQLTAAARRLEGELGPEQYLLASGTNLGGGVKLRLSTVWVRSEATMLIYK